MSILEIKKGQNHIAKVESQSFVDGEGVRCSVYVSGCPFQCEKCYNVKAQNFNTGILYTEELEEQICSRTKNSYGMMASSEKKWKNNS